MTRLDQLLTPPFENALNRLYEIRNAVFACNFQNNERECRCISWKFYNVFTELMEPNLLPDGKCIAPFEDGDLTYFMLVICGIWMARVPKAFLPFAQAAFMRMSSVYIEISCPSEKYPGYRAQILLQNFMANVIGSLRIHGPITLGDIHRVMCANLLVENVNGVEVTLSDPGRADLAYVSLALYYQHSLDTSHSGTFRSKLESLRFKLTYEGSKQLGDSYYYPMKVLYVFSDAQKTSGMIEVRPLIGIKRSYDSAASIVVYDEGGVTQGCGTNHADLRLTAAAAPARGDTMVAAASPSSGRGAASTAGISTGGRGAASGASGGPSLDAPASGKLLTRLCDSSAATLENSHQHIRIPLTCNCLPLVPRGHGMVFRHLLHHNAVFFSCNACTVSIFSGCHVLQSRREYAIALSVLLVEVICGTCDDTVPLATLEVFRLLLEILVDGCDSLQLFPTFSVVITCLVQHGFVDYYRNGRVDVEYCYKYSWLLFEVLRFLGSYSKCNAKELFTLLFGEETMDQSVGRLLESIAVLLDYIGYDYSE